jgi:hypothetical protein
VGGGREKEDNGGGIISKCIIFMYKDGTMKPTKNCFKRGRGGKQWGVI